jgi:hypothetical protein
MKIVPAFIVVIIVACAWFATHGNTGAMTDPHFGFATVRNHKNVYLCTGSLYNCVKIYGPHMAKHPKIGVCGQGEFFHFCKVS